jgi:hypothetical protein
LKKSECPLELPLAVSSKTNIGNPSERRLTDWRVTYSMTDSSTTLKGALKGRKHDQVNHFENEYVRYENGLCITTNGIEGFFANLKRGINGVYHHVGQQHLHRYLSEFDYRYNTRKESDSLRTVEALKSTTGKRLMLRDSRQQSN